MELLPRPLGRLGSIPGQAIPPAASEKAAELPAAEGLVPAASGGIAKLLALGYLRLLRSSPPNRHPQANLEASESPQTRCYDGPPGVMDGVREPPATHSTERG